MNHKVLVTYASKYGSTAEIAEKIGQLLRKSELQADVMPANRAGDPTNYQAVIVGSAVYIGQWRREAASFLKANEKILAQKPVWLFSSGPTGEGDLEALLQGWRFPKGLQPIADRIQPRDIAVFRGAVETQKLNPLEKWMMKQVKAAGGDFRDWEAITSWVAAVAVAVKENGQVS